MVDLLVNPFLMDAVVCWKPCSSSELWSVWKGKVGERRGLLLVDPVFIRDVVFVAVLMNHFGNLKSLNLVLEM